MRISCIKRGCHLDMTGKVWAYEPDSHKTEHHRRHRIIYFDPRAQRVLGPVLKSDVSAYLFSPREIKMRGTWPSKERHDANDPEPADTVSQEERQGNSWK